MAPSMMRSPAVDTAPQALYSSKPLRSTRFVLSPTERWAIMGKTGSGKTEFAKWLDRQFVTARWPLLIIDSKHGYIDEDVGERYASEPATSSVDHPWLIQDGIWQEGVPVQIFLPQFPARSDPRLSALFYHVLDRGSTVVHIDDMLGLADANNAPEALNALWGLGRKRRVPVLALASRSVDIPLLMTQQSENKVFFRLPGLPDRKRAVEWTNDPRLLEVLPDYYFFYFHDDMDHARRYAPLSPWEIRARR